MCLIPSPKRETNKCSTLIAGAIHQSVSFGAVVFRRKTFTLWGGPYKRSWRCGLNSRKLAFFISGFRGFGTHAVLVMRQSVVACRWKMCFCSGVVLVCGSLFGVFWTKQEPQTNCPNNATVVEEPAKCCKLQTNPRQMTEVR